MTLAAYTTSKFFTKMVSLKKTKYQFHELIEKDLRNLKEKLLQTSKRCIYIFKKILLLKLETGVDNKRYWEEV